MLGPSISHPVTRNPCKPKFVFPTNVIFSRRDAEAQRNAYEMVISLKEREEGQGGVNQRRKANNATP